MTTIDVYIFTIYLYDKVFIRRTFQVIRRIFVVLW